MLLLFFSRLLNDKEGYTVELLDKPFNAKAFLMLPLWHGQVFKRRSATFLCCIWMPKDGGLFQGSREHSTLLGNHDNETAGRRNVCPNSIQSHNPSV